MPQALKLSKRSATVANINRRVEKAGGGDEPGNVVVDIDLDTHIDLEEIAQLVRVQEGEPLDFVRSLFTSDGNARCLNMKPIALEEIPNTALSILIGDDTLLCVGKLRRVKLAIGESLRGAKLHVQAAFEPDEGDEHQAAVLLHMPAEVQISVKAGPQKELELGEPKGRRKKGEADDAGAAVH